MDMNESNDSLTPLEVKLNLPEKADLNDKVKVDAYVTKGDEKIKDADQVEFEWWKDGEKSKSTIVKAKNMKNGHYEAELSWKEDGNFMVQSHVTARSMHTMPMKSIAVGNAMPMKAEESMNHDDSMNMDMDHESKDVMVQFIKPQTVVTQQMLTMTAKVKNEMGPVEAANVRFEVWNTIDKKHKWINTEELERGGYSGQLSFEEKGDYTIKIHVEKGDKLHIHKEEMVEVK
jgi:5-hydroxyisourate hydrolase-like protein (transthyretin family)